MYAILLQLNCNEKNTKDNREIKNSFQFNKFSYLPYNFFFIIELIRKCLGNVLEMSSYSITIPQTCLKFKLFDNKLLLFEISKTEVEHENIFRILSFLYLHQRLDNFKQSICQDYYAGIQHHNDLFQIGFATKKFLTH